MYGIRNPNQKQPKPSEPTKVKINLKGKARAKGFSPNGHRQGKQFLGVQPPIGSS